ncbi:MAG: 50S ribosomal protein L15 [Planctomycetes bacterium]|nr:50S ribosomal protein L15 [Planctomycetota bacterium]
MMLDSITKAAGGRPRRKRVGRGESSGHGRTSGRGNKGAGARAGYKSKRLYEGGQKALYSRFPKRGFNNFNFRTEYTPVNLADLERSFNDGDKVDVDALKALRLVQGCASKVKILGDGELKKKLRVTAHAFSADARSAIEKAGGSCELLPKSNAAAAWKAKRRSAKGKKRVSGPSRIDKKKAARANA